METTRHFTATTYVVADGATALHYHPKLGLHLPPGGHLARDELPHEAARREVREETGLDPTLVADDPDIASPTGRSLPQPAAQMLYDIDVRDGAVYHQHVDHVYFASVPSRDVDPDDGEEPADAWTWFTSSDLDASDLDPDVVDLGTRAIRAVADA